MPFRFEARIRYDGVVAGDEGKRNVAAIRSLYSISMVLMHYDASYIPWGPQCLVSVREPPVVGT